MERVTQEGVKRDCVEPSSPREQRRLEELRRKEKRQREASMHMLCSYFQEQGSPFLISAKRPTRGCPI